MYRTLLARCEYGVRSQWRWHIAFANELLKFAEPHVASNVRYIAFSMRTNTLLTPIKARYISHLGYTPNTAEPHAFKQGVPHCLATT